MTDSHANRLIDLYCEALEEMGYIFKKVDYKIKKAVITLIKDKDVITYSSGGHTPLGMQVGALRKAYWDFKQDKK